MHKEFVCDLESALTDDEQLTQDIVIGPAFHKLVSIDLRLLRMEHRIH